MMLFVHALTARDSRLADLACGRIRAREMNRWKDDLSTDLCSNKLAGLWLQGHTCHPKPWAINPLFPWWLLDDSLFKVLKRSCIFSTISISPLEAWLTSVCLERSLLYTRVPNAFTFKSFGQCVVSSHRRETWYDRWAETTTYVSAGCMYVCMLVCMYVCTLRMYVVCM